MLVVRSRVGCLWITGVGDVFTCVNKNLLFCVFSHKQQSNTEEKTISTEILTQNVEQYLSNHSFKTLQQGSEFTHADLLHNVINV